MSTTPEDLKYTKTHEWVRLESNGDVTIGITDHAQGLLGDMVFIELPEVGDNFSAGDDCAVVESVKAASDVYCPIAGEITEVNSELSETPEMVNKEPFGTGWLYRIKPADSHDLDELLDASAYKELAESEQH